MKILQDYDLTKLNTFGITAKAKFFVELEKEEDFSELIETDDFKNNSKLFLGGGSNVLFTKDFDGLVILNRIKGMEILKEDAENVWIKTMGGEWWNDLVLFSVEKGYWGIENLSLIPGTVGAAPMQNIGAYGREVADVIENVEVYKISNGKKEILSKEECEFGYRDSIFKNKSKGKYFIMAVIFKLSKNENKNIKYKILEDYLKMNQKEIKSSSDVALIVAEIRKSKLPDPKVLGNAGSFFKNVYVTIEKLEELIKVFPDISFFQEGDLIKIPTGWLVEHCGPTDGKSWKGYRLGNVGVHEKQALVLVNYGGATGLEVLNFADKIIGSVFLKFGLKISPEVNFV